MKVSLFPLGCVLLLASTLAAQTTLVRYSFTGNVTTPTITHADLTASSFGSNLLGTTSNSSPVSSGYTGSSGSYYFYSDAWTGSAPGSNYFSFSLTPDPGMSVSLASISFGYKGSSTLAPTSFLLRSSADNYSSNLLTGSLTADATNAWYNTGTQSVTLSFTSTTTFRIYAGGASNAGATLRLDDVVMSGSTSAIPEPSTYAAIAGLSALVFASLRRRRRSACAGA